MAIEHDSKFISIVIPVFNAERFLTATVSGVLGQTVATWELVLIDDGSTDDSYRVAAEFADRDSRIRVFKQTNSGVAAARNAGYRRICPESEFVVFLDHDDVWEATFLSRLSAELRDDTAASGAYGLARGIDSDGFRLPNMDLEYAQKQRKGFREGRLVVWPVDRPSDLDLLALWSYITTPGQVLIRRGALSDQDPFDPAVAPADDMDLWVRLGLNGHLRLVDEVLINYRFHETNASRDQSKMDAAIGRARHKAYWDLGATNRQRTVIRRAYRHWQKDLALRSLKHCKELLTRGRAWDFLLEWSRFVGHGAKSLVGRP